MRKNQTALLAAAAVALSGLSFVVPASAADRSNDIVAPNISPENDVSGRNTQSRQDVNRSDRDNVDIKGVRMLLSHATDAATRENGFGDFVGYFDNGNSATNREADHARTATESGTQSRTPASPAIGDSAKSGGAADQANDADQKDLNKAVAQFRSDWKAKYNQDFSIANESVVYSDITNDAIQPEARSAGAELHRDARTSADDTRPNLSGTNADQTSPTSPGSISNQAQRDAADHASQTQQPGRSLQHGASEAAANGQQFDLSVPAYKHAPAVTVPVVRESQNDYRFARTSSFDRAQLSQNLAHHIQAVDDHKDQWPSDVNEAYRVVTQHVLMAISDTDGNSARPAGAELRGARDRASDRLNSNAGTIDSSTNADRNNPTGINK